jgi:hypothetical protein
MPSPRRYQVFVAVLASSLVCAPVTQPADLLIVTGGGAGNGVGMSQWGAEGYARHGWDYRRILAHYYPQTTLTQVSDLPVRVLLLDRRPSVALSSKAPFLLVDSRGLRVHVPARTVRLGSRRGPPSRCACR